MPDSRPQIDLSFTVNGRPVSVTAEPRETLLQVLRTRVGLTGAKHSCDMQVCGACTVLVDDAPVSACTYLAYEARGRSVTTIEGVARDGCLHPVQEAFIAEHGFQCGFCTSGMILSTIALLEEQPDPTDQQIQDWLRGNICRCTGYLPIVHAVQAAAAKLRGKEDKHAG